MIFSVESIKNIKDNEREIEKPEFVEKNKNLVIFEWINESMIKSKKSQMIVHNNLQ